MFLDFPVSLYLSSATFHGFGRIFSLKSSSGFFAQTDERRKWSKRSSQTADLKISLYLTTQAERLKSISIVHEFGALAPLTESGTIMVNNVSTSCCKSRLVSAPFMTLRFFQTHRTPTSWLTLHFCPPAGGPKSSSTTTRARPKRASGATSLTSSGLAG